VEWQMRGMAAKAKWLRGKTVTGQRASTTHILREPMPNRRTPAIASYSQGGFMIDMIEMSSAETVENVLHPILASADSRLGAEVIGDSPAFNWVVQQVQNVAPTDSAVLITGETGTGKELVARAIHSLSPRRDNAFIQLNCAAIPATLLENELFGHERGAFTGAVTQQVGRFQLANRGTIFLDEIGEMPLELQPKLLRVLQEQEFERLGNSRTISINVRILAATNQNLQQMVQERRFRADLYYRLNVFPIDVPPLRARAGDIPALVQHFVAKFSREMNKGIEHIPAEVMEVLRLHDWPGNIRELENFIRRAVIMSPGPTLRPPLAELIHVSRAGSTATRLTLAEAERQHILEVLRETKWVLGGFQGAAVRLGIPRTTLVYRMQKLGITRGQILGAARNSAGILRKDAWGVSQQIA
jgi:formate hydrogenlyase transcriptional activator